MPLTRSLYSSTHQCIHLIPAYPPLISCSPSHPLFARSLARCKGLSRSRSLWLAGWLAGCGTAVGALLGEAALRPPSRMWGWIPHVHLIVSSFLPVPSSAFASPSFWTSSSSSRGTSSTPSPSCLCFADGVWRTSPSPASYFYR